MHRHRDKDQAAPFVGKSETAAENEERQGRGQMVMRGGEERGVKEQADDDSEIAAKNTINKKAKDKLLRHWRDDHCQNNDHHPLPNGLGAVEKIDNLLSARTAAEKALGDYLPKKNQWGDGEEKNDAGADRAFETGFGKT